VFGISGARTEHCALALGRANTHLRPQLHYSNLLSKLIMRKQISHYVVMTFVFVAVIAVLLKYGSAWYGITTPTQGSSLPHHVQSLHILENAKSYLGVFLLQLVTVIAISKIIGKLFQAAHLPSVVGEMFAGILLGPSLFGWWAPEIHAVIFPLGSLDSIKALSQVGVLVFMFCVGVELDVASLKKKANTALLVSHVSILMPFVFGAAAALLLYPFYAPKSTDFKTFTMFMGISMSITAFPVLASIIKERRLEKTALGTTALACAAIDDVTAWLLLAGIIGFARAEGVVAAGVTFALATVFCVTMIWYIRPKIGRWHQKPHTHDGAMMVPLMLFVFASALATELIGIHALFGAFIAGVAASKNEAIKRFSATRVEPFASAVLLPLFFCYTGLRTEIGLIDSLQEWMVAAAIVLLATLGKLGGAAIAARMTGASWREALSLGALMNTRGLMELVVLNIGLDLGIITPSLFSIMVVMALITTLMTGPLLSLFQRNIRAPLNEENSNIPPGTVLVPTSADAKISGR